MTLSSLSHALDDVAADLPFAIGDFDAANEAFRRWRTAGSEEDYELLLKWLFCYTRRYFISKWMQEPELLVEDMEEPLTTAFQRCRRALHQIREHEGFSSYISVVCKNTYLNFWRSRRRYPKVDIDSLPQDLVVDTDYDPLVGHDRAVLVAAVHRAVERLPSWLRNVARRRLVDGLSYDELVQETGLSRATLRSYVNKAVIRLRDDPGVAPLVREWEE